MEPEKILCFLAMLIAGLAVLAFAADAAVGIPFGRVSILLDVLFVLGGGLMLWQALATYRELR